MSNKDNLSLYYHNCNGILYRLEKFFENLLKKEPKYDIICLTETHLNASIQETQIFGPEYFIYRRDRDCLVQNKKNKGGVLIALNIKKLCNIESHRDQETLMEDAWISFERKFDGKGDGKRINICCTYDPHHMPDIVRNRHLWNIYETVANRELGQEFIILGDYNLKQASPDANNFHQLMKERSGLKDCLIPILVDRPNTLDTVYSTLEVTANIAKKPLVLDKKERERDKHPAIELGIEVIDSQLLHKRTPEENWEIEAFRDAVEKDLPFYKKYEEAVEAIQRSNDEVHQHPLIDLIRNEIEKMESIRKFTATLHLNDDPTYIVAEKYNFQNLQIETPEIWEYGERRPLNHIEVEQYVPLRPFMDAIKEWLKDLLISDEANRLRSHIEAYEKLRRGEMIYKTYDDQNYLAEEPLRQNIKFSHHHRVVLYLNRA